MSKFVLLLFILGLFVHIPFISAQEVQPTGDLSVTNESEIEIDDSEEEDSFQARREELDEAERGMSIDEPSAGVPGAGPSIWALVRMLLVLAVVAAAIYGIVFLFKRSSKKAPSDDPFLKILSNAHLGSNRYVHIVSVGSRAWLLGSSDGGVNVISEIDDKDIINSMLLEDSKKTASAVTGRFPDFLSLLRKLGTPAGNRNQGADEIRKRRERLKGL